MGPGALSVPQTRSSALLPCEVRWGERHMARLTVREYTHHCESRVQTRRRYVAHGVVCRIRNTLAAVWGRGGDEA